MTNSLEMQQQTKQSLEPISLIQQALSSGTSPEVIRELVALQQSMERFNWEREERQSKIDFDNALNDCQQHIGRIAPNVKRNDTNSWWADYAQLDATVRPVYTLRGFSIAFSETDPISPGKVRIKASLSRGGISKDYFREITPSTTGPRGNAMATQTDADAIAGARAKRYLIIDIFNIAIGIDKTEKQGIPTSRLPESKLIEWVDSIAESSTQGELTARYIQALKVAASPDDKQVLEDAANKRKRELAK